MRKKFLAVVLAAALACNTTGVSAAVQSPVAGASVFKSFGDLFKGDSDDEEDTQSDTQKNTKRSQVYSADPEAVKDSVVLDISRGNIRITGTEVSGYDTDGNPVTKTSSRYVVTGSSREHSIEIASGANANIVLSNASIIRTEAGESPIWIADDSTGDVTLTLEGTNTLQAGTGAAAIQKNCTYNGSISKYGQLKITCGNISPSHICGADCGTLVATAGNGGAAIGGADGMGSSKINIVGGTITASGGIGAGVGGTGTKVEIGGGVIDAGTINSKDSVLNGNAILMADSVGDMKITKGVLVQNGKGTAYGDLDLTQGMIDHLVQSGGELDISDGAQVAVADGVDASKINTNGTGTIKQEQSGQSEEGSSEEGSSEEKPSEEKPADQAVASAETEAAEKEKPSLLQKAGKALAKVMGQDDGVEVDEGQEEGIATVSDTDVPKQTSVGIQIFKNEENNYVGFSDIEYGQAARVEASLLFWGDINNGTGESNPSIHCFLEELEKVGDDWQPVNRVEIASQPLTQAPSHNQLVVVSSNFIMQDDPPSVSITLNKTYRLYVEFTGTEDYPGGNDTSGPFTIQPGKMIFPDPIIPKNAIAGTTIKNTMGGQTLDNYLAAYRPTNAGGEPVKGEWQWDEPDLSDVEGERLYPGVTGGKYQYNVKYEVDKSEVDKYLNGKECTTIIEFNVEYQTFDDAEPRVICSSHMNHPQNNGNDGLTWYNADCGNITIVADGYQILKTPNPPNSVEGWRDGFGDNLLFTEYHKEDYAVYIKDRVKGEIGRVVLKDFNVDQSYPQQLSLKDSKINPTNARLEFNISDGEQNNCSGIWKCWWRAQRRLAGEDSYSAEEVIAANNEFSQFVDVPGCSPSTTYDLYMVVEDIAGNQAHYTRRVIDDDPPGTALEPARDPNEFYAYDFTTALEAITGTVEMTISAGDGSPKLNSEIAPGDIVIATPRIGNTDPGELRYDWFLREEDETETPLSAFNTNTFTIPTRSDLIKDYIGRRIVCRVSSTKTSGDKAGIIDTPIGLLPCPDDYKPNIIEEDTQNFTVTFEGKRGIAYEYRTNGSETWTKLDLVANGRYTIQLNEEETVLAGKLEIRAQAIPNQYSAGESVTNQEDFYGSSELDIALSGEGRYGEILTAKVNSQVNPSRISYVWLRDGAEITDPGASGTGSTTTYQVKKDDLYRVISVRFSIEGATGADNTKSFGTIARRKVKGTVSVNAKEYDGTTAGTARADIEGALPGDDLSGGEAQVEFADKNAGENKNVKLLGTIEITGKDSLYYEVELTQDANLKGTIRPKTLNLEMTAEDKVYDGKTDAVVTFKGDPLPGDNIEITGTGQFDNKNVGKNKTVTPKEVVITGPDKDNYTSTGSTASTTAEITTKALEIESITVADKVYDGTTDAAISVNFTGAVDDVDYSYTAAFDSPNVGKDKRVDATIKLEGDSATNYTLANGAATGRGNIVKTYAPYDEANIPQNLTGIEGKKLSSVYIGPGFSWKDTETVMASVGRHTYPAYYNPDPSQYSAREIELEVLVQCAEHIWGEWVITTDPTKTDLGERQRICGVCGYTETEVIPRAPYINNEDNKVGWGDIIQAINNASSGTEIPVVMNGTETLPASVQEALQGREVSLVLHMGDDISWTIRGEDITGTTLKDINMVVTLYTDNIPSDVIDAYLPNKATVQVHLAYSGEFGFVATLRIPLGDEFAGKASTLYYYNPTRERLEMMDSNKVTSDGMGRYDFTHASDYVVALDRPANVQGGDTPSGNGSVTPTAPTGTTTPGAQGGSATNGNNGNTGTTTGTNGSTAAATGTATSANGTVVSSNGAKTEDDTPIMLYLFLLLAGTAGITAGVAYRRKRKTGN